MKRRNEAVPRQHRVAAVGSLWAMVAELRQPSLMRLEWKSKFTTTHEAPQSRKSLRKVVIRRMVVAKRAAIMAFRAAAHRASVPPGSWMRVERPQLCCETESHSTPAAFSALISISRSSVIKYNSCMSFSSDGCSVTRFAWSSFSAWRACRAPPASLRVACRSLAQASFNP
jgi:hypothetical protein